MTEETKPKKILVIRSATRILNQTLVALREEFPGCHITVMVPQSVKESMEEDPQVNEVLTIPDQRRMSVASYGKENIRRMQETKFDLAVALYNIDHGLGYSNIDLLACATKAKKVRGYNSKGTFVEINSSTVRKKAFLEKTTFFWVGINYLATAILFFIITIALTGEWLFRCIFRKKHKAPASQTVVASPPSVREPVKAQV
ncbi:MAG: hypothetical protein HOK41_03730 [Nitrospina sp.]|jgi:hypothetical protein|nr:hypothetical protein [Nitrospina sp.]MBT6716849.1 hypothetical protein [Nitrospina sp.]